jgi:hypothetical protein
VEVSEPILKNPIRFFAVLCVAATSAYVMWMGYRLNDVLASPGWCATALGAGKAASGGSPIKGLEACVGLLTIQLRSIATNSHILFGVIAMCLLVLIVIVIAGAKLDLKGNLKDGNLEGHMGKDRDDPPSKVSPDVVAAAASGAASGATAAAAAAPSIPDDELPPQPAAP